ncbi:MAG: TonB-dependent receptor plug domain-containing protein [Gemmatimonadaceae bacterium]|nr:TonB-dependent receptor plug domain-containing protein [Gemmatimonadaceae bacterium]
MRTRGLSLPGLTVGLGTIAALLFGAASSLTAQSKPSADAAFVRVHIRNDAGDALGGAQLRLGASTSAESDAGGVATMVRVAPGEGWMRVRRIGYRPESLYVRTAAGVLVDTNIVLTRVVVDLTPITVLGRRDVKGPMAGFYRRQATGSGRFITAADIEKRSPNNLTDLLRSIPGFRIETRGFRNNVRIRGSRCAPLIWLDGQGLFAGDVDLDSFDPMSFDGIEVYSGGASVPVEFQWNQAASSSCGTLVLWSRRGQLRSPKTKNDAISPAALIAQWLDEGKVFTSADVDRGAVIDSTSIVKPLYPDSLFLAQVGGTVLAEFVVNANGTVASETISAVTSSHRAFIAPVRRALLEQRFAPAMRQGKAVQQIIQQPFTFVPDSTARRGR